MFKMSNFLKLVKNEKSVPEASGGSGEHHSRIEHARDETLVCPNEGCGFSIPATEYRKHSPMGNSCPDCVKAGRETGTNSENSLMTESYRKAKTEGREEEYHQPPQTRR
jgi:hypothetical protein